MKTAVIFLWFILMAVAAAAQTPSTLLEGTWEMVSRRSVYADSIVTPAPVQGPSFKILNGTHFAFGRQTVQGGEAMDDVYAGGGRYTVDGDSMYVEHVEYHSSAGLVGQSLRFRCRVDGDIWYHSGQIGDFLLEETWRRVR